MKKLLCLLLMLCSMSSQAQNMQNNRAEIDKAKSELSMELSAFSNCIPAANLDSCIDTLVQKAKTPYQQYLIGGVLYKIDRQQAYQLHKAAYLSNPQELNFILEYALELHRNGEYKEAAALYEQYQKENPKSCTLTKMYMCSPTGLLLQHFFLQTCNTRKKQPLLEKKQAGAITAVRGGLVLI